LCEEHGLDKSGYPEEASKESMSRKDVFFNQTADGRYIPRALVNISFKCIHALYIYFSSSCLILNPGFWIAFETQNSGGFIAMKICFVLQMVLVLAIIGQVDTFKPKTIRYT